MKFRFIVIYIASALVVLGLAYNITHKISSHSYLSQEAGLAKKKAWNFMAAQVDTWTDRLGMPIDPEIKETIIVLNLLGFTTQQSCEGHLDWGSSYPWVSFVDKSPETLEMENHREELERALEKEEAVIREKNPTLTQMELYLHEEDIAEFSQHHKIRKQLQELNKKVNQNLARMLKKLHELLGSFYDHHFSSYDSLLALSIRNRLVALGSEWQETRDQTSQEKKLKEYLQEFKRFTKFLKQYWESLT